MLSWKAFWKRPWGRKEMIGRPFLDVGFGYGVGVDGDMWVGSEGGIAEGFVAEKV